MPQHAVFELFAIVLAIPLSYLLAVFVKRLSEPGYKEDIQSDFLREWNGKPEDEYYAWIRLRERYRHMDMLPKHFTYIKQQLAMINKRSHLSDYSVSESGAICSLKERENSDESLDG